MGLFESPMSIESTSAPCVGRGATGSASTHWPSTTASLSFVLNEYV